VVFAGLVLVAFGLRSAATSVSPILLTIDKDIHFDALSIGLLGMAAPFTFAIFGAVAPAIARRIGLEWTVIIAASAIGIGEIARAASQETNGFLFWSFFSMAGTGAANVVLPPLVKKFFPDRIGGMSTIYLSMAVLGSVIPAYLAAPIAASADWRTSIALWGYLAIVAVLPWIGQIIRERGHASTFASTTDPGIARRVLTSPTSWAITTSFAIAAFNCYIMWAWLPVMLQERIGMSEGDTGMMLALYTFMSVPISLFGPLLVTRLKSTTPLILMGIIVVFLGTLGLWLIPEVATWLWVALSGLGMIFFNISLVLINVRTSGPAGAVALSGMTQGVGYLIGALGPLTVGFIHSFSDDWTLDYVLLLVSALAGIFPLFVLRRNAKVDEKR
jgi:CP family cyanate transporter-like MFS transporter